MRSSPKRTGCACRVAIVFKPWEDDPYAAFIVNKRDSYHEPSGYSVWADPYPGIPVIPYPGIFVTYIKTNKKYNHSSIPPGVPGVPTEIFEIIFCNRVASFMLILFVRIVHADGTTLDIIPVDGIPRTSYSYAI